MFCEVQQPGLNAILTKQVLLYHANQDQDQGPILKVPLYIKPCAQPHRAMQNINLWSFWRALSVIESFSTTILFHQM